MLSPSGSRRCQSTASTDGSWAETHLDAAGLVGDHPSAGPTMFLKAMRAMQSGEHREMERFMRLMQFPRPRARAPRRAAVPIREALIAQQSFERVDQGVQIAAPEKARFTLSHRPAAPSPNTR